MISNILGESTGLSAIISIAVQAPPKGLAMESVSELSKVVKSYKKRAHKKNGFWLKPAKQFQRMWQIEIW